MKKWIATGLMITVAVNLWAQAPEIFRYQGRLESGATLVNATLPMSFKLYNASSGGTKLYEDSNSVPVVNGLYATYVGDNTVFGSLTNAMTNAAVYLELTINGETLAPRERLVSVPYALNAPAPAAPVVGDPAAVSNEVINARWTKNYYANGDITMSDRDTGLMWLYNANSLGGPTNWSAAAIYCDELTYAGYSDWRLPRISEVKMQFYSSDYFKEVKIRSSAADYYWSGTFTSEDLSRVHVVSMGNGSISSNYRDETYEGSCVWPVRGGLPLSVERVIGIENYDDGMYFGASFWSDSKTATLVIVNNGFKPLTVTGISYSDAHFSGNWSGTLDPLESTYITVTFTPTIATNYSGTITVHGDQTSGNNSIGCSGTWVEMPYVDNGDGTVTDTTTGLMWMKDANHGQMTWSNAVAYCANLTYAGYSDWRLPSFSPELRSLFRANGSWTGHEGTPFTGVQSSFYWSGTSYASNTGYAWYVYMSDYGKMVGYNDKTGSFYVWPVRGGQ